MKFINKCTLSDREIFYKELQIKYIKTIYKSLIGEDIDPEILLSNLNNVLKKISTLSLQEINSLNFLDYFTLLFNICITSTGNIIFAQLNNEDNTTVEINIYKFLEVINSYKINTLLEPEIFNNIKIYYTLPTLQNIVKISQKDRNDTIYHYFINKIIFQDTEINFSFFSESETKLILEKLPVKITTHIIKKINTIFDTFNKINLLANIPYLKEKTIPFNFNINNLIDLIKILFGEDLLTLYENIFALCKLGNFTPEYIENCTPGEYILYVKKLDSIMNKQQTTDTNFTSDEGFDHINGDLL